MVDDWWFVDVESDIARDRVAKRHIKAGIETNWEGAVRRASGNDLINSDEAQKKLVKPEITVHSVNEV